MGPNQPKDTVDHERQTGIAFRMPEKHGLVQQQGFRRHDRQASSHRTVLSRLQRRDLYVLHLVLVIQSRHGFKSAGWHDGRCVWTSRFPYVYQGADVGVPYRVAFRIPVENVCHRRQKQRDAVV